MGTWAIIALAGGFEIAWAIGLKYSGGFSRPVPSLIYACMVLSVAFLGVSMKAMPVGTAYAIWTGIGTVGTAILGIYLFGESRAPIRMTFIFIIVVGVVGLYLTEQ
jgi:quaternary ammonium compound-resistance protein SugE